MTRPAQSQPETPDVVDGLAQVSYVVMAALSQAAASYDLSLTQLRVLAILRNHKPRMAELADYLGLDRSSVSGLVDRAAARDLVRREASAEDGRGVRVALGPAGRRLAAPLSREVVDLLAPLTDRLTGAEQQRLTGLLTKMLDAPQGPAVD